MLKTINCLHGREVLKSKFWQEACKNLVGFFGKICNTWLWWYGIWYIYAYYILHYKVILGMVKKTASILKNFLTPGSYFIDIFMNIFIYLFRLIFIPKLKVPPGCRSLRWSDSHCPWSQALALCRWALHSLSYIPLCGSALTNTMDNLSKMCPLKITDFAFFCTVNHTGAAYSPNGFQKLSWPRLEPAIPRWESQYSDHAQPIFF